MIRTSVVFAVMGASIVLLAGCALTRPVEDRTHFYLLKPVEPDAGVQEAGMEEAAIIGLRRIRPADYLDTPAVVVRTGENSLRYATHHRWAEGIDRGVARVLRESLRKDPRVSAVFFFPEASREAVDYELEVYLLACEIVETAGEPGRYSIEAFWNLYESEGRNVVASGDFSRQGPWERGDYAGFARSASVTFGELGREIAANLETGAASR